MRCHVKHRILVFVGRIILRILDARRNRIDQGV